MTLYQFLTQFIDEPSEVSLSVVCPDDTENPNMRFNEWHNEGETVADFFNLHTEKSAICELMVSSISVDGNCLCIVALR